MGLPRYFWGWILLVATACSLYSFGPNLQARWWVLDDHEIVQFLGPNHVLPLSRVPAEIAQTEVAWPGGWIRYRPTYYSLRVLEASQWGDRTTLWYGARIAVFAASLLILGILLAPTLGVPGTLLLVASVASQEYWADIFARLGPAETYAIPGLGLFVLGWKWLLEKKIYRGSLVWALGAILAVGSKESFLFLLLPILWLPFELGRRKIIKKIFVAIWLVVSSYSIFIAWAILSGLAKWGHDEHSTPIGLVSHLHLLARSLLLRTPLHFGFALATLIALSLGGLKRDKIQRWAAPTWTLMVSLALFMGVFVSQFVIYSGDWPVEHFWASRYNFPGLLTFPLMSWAFTRFALGALPLPWRKSWIAAVILAIGLALTGQFPTPQAFAKIRDHSIYNRDRSLAYTSHIETLVAKASTQPQWPVVLVSTHPRDWEVLLAVKIFARWYGLKNPVQIALYGYEQAESESAHNLRLGKDIRTWRDEGKRGFDAWKEPIDNQYFCVGMSYSVPLPCQDLGVFSGEGSVRPPR